MKTLTEPLDYVETETSEIRIARYGLVNTSIRCFTAFMVVVMFAWTVQVWTIAEYKRSELGLKVAEMEKRSCKAPSAFPSRAPMLRDS